MNATVPELRSERSDTLFAEWDELAGRHPAPTLDDVRDDWLWARERAATGALDPDGRSAGLHVAVFERRVVGTGPDAIELQVRLARELSLHPERLVVLHLPE